LRMALFVCGVLIFVQIYGIAITHHPLGWFYSQS